MALLTGVSITFDTHDDDKDASTMVSVFVKNRLGNSLSTDFGSDYISNFLSLARYQDPNDLGDGRQNPYLAHRIGMGVGYKFDDPSTLQFPLWLTPNTITFDEILLPVVDIHILNVANDTVRWIFDYTVSLAFDEEDKNFSFSSKPEVGGIILDWANRDHSGLGVERTMPPFFPKAETDSVLERITLDFYTHKDDTEWNKDSDTRLDVQIVNRISNDVTQDLAVGLDLLHDQDFPAGSLNSVVWSADGTPRPLDSVGLADIVLPVVYIDITPEGHDRWIFDYRVTFDFRSAGDFNGKRLTYSSQTNGVVLDQDNTKHSGAYHGRPFPTVSPATAPHLTPQPVDHTGDNRKVVSVDFLQQKFKELINDRKGTDASHNPPLNKIQLTSITYPASPDAVPGYFIFPESYVDRRGITAGKTPAYVSNPTYVSNPMSIGQLFANVTSFDDQLGDTILYDIHSTSISLNVDPSDDVTPFTLKVYFAPYNPDDGSGSLEVDLFGLIRIIEFSITLKLTLDLKHRLLESGATQTVIDVMSWVDEFIDMGKNAVFLYMEGSQAIYHFTGSALHEQVDMDASVSALQDFFAEKAIKVHLTTGDAVDPQGTLRGIIRNKIFGKLIDQDPFTHRMICDNINSMVTSWLTGGVADNYLNTDSNNDSNTDSNNIVIEDVGINHYTPELGIEENSIYISYHGPQNVFVPQMPADWPAAYDLSPGTLANIDHIIVLMKENRSFDHLLGYLSLPEEIGGMGRQDVDGLTGGETNIYKGTYFDPYELPDDLARRFHPGPPNDHESVQRAINGGHMDGFVRSQADAYGDPAAGRVMGYHTGATVPHFDALARDFAIGHRWFASHPGPTFPNRFYELTGRLNLDPRGFWELENSRPIPVFTPTIFDYLDGATDPRSGVPYTWRYFEHGYCTLRLFEQHTFDHDNIIDMDDPVDGFFACARTGQLPNVSFIDPHFLDYPPDSNCDEPPSDVAAGQDLVQRIVEAVVASPAWNRTLLVIVYDEHGGFYDHVPPPPAPKVSPELPVTTYGVRVPAFVISPWVAAGTVFGHDEISVGGRLRDSLYFDHTSILKTIVRRFLHDNPPPMGARFAAAHDLSEVIGNDLRNPQFLPFIRYRLEYVRSQMLATVNVANPALGTELLQLLGDDTNDTIPQDFSFEDAGNGLVYIRSHWGNLYVTVEEAAADPGPTGLRIIQDRKYPSTSATDVGTKRPELQRWRLSPVSITVLDGDRFLISSEAYPTLFLQPIDPTKLGSPLTLGDSGGPGGVRRLPPNTWKVTSPLFSDEIVSTQ